MSYYKNSGGAFNKKRNIWGPETRAYEYVAVRRAYSVRHQGRGLSAADADGDGDLDVFAAAARRVGPKA